MATTSYHMGLSVRGALRWDTGRLRDLAKSIEDEAVVTAADAREWLLNQLSLGREVLPIGDCDCWDFKSGCPGHALSREGGGTK